MNASSIDPALQYQQQQQPDGSPDQHTGRGNDTIKVADRVQQEMSQQPTISPNQRTTNASFLNATPPNTQKAKSTSRTLTPLEAFNLLARPSAMIERLAPSIRERIAFYALKMDKRPIILNYPLGTTPALHWFYAQQFKRQVINLALASPMFMIDMRTTLERLGRIIIGGSRRAFSDSEMEAVPSSLAAIGHPQPPRDSHVHLKLVIRGFLRQLRAQANKLKEINLEWLKKREARIKHYKNKMKQQRRESKGLNKMAKAEGLLGELMYVEGDVVVPSESVAAEDTIRI